MSVIVFGSEPSGGTSAMRRGNFPIEWYFCPKPLMWLKECTKNVKSFDLSPQWTKNTVLLEISGETYA